MFGKLKRLGTASCKVQITIELKWLTILDSKDYRPGLYIDFERGSKTVSSTSRELPVDPVDSKLVVYFDECLTLVMTLYKDTSGKFIEKKGKLVLKGVSTMSTTVVKLGSVNLSLHTLADHFEKKNMILQFGDSKGRTMGTINLATTAKYLGDTEANDEDAPRQRRSQPCIPAPVKFRGRQWQRLCRLVFPAVPQRLPCQRANFWRAVLLQSPRSHTGWKQPSLEGLAHG